MTQNSSGRPLRAVEREGAVVAVSWHAREQARARFGDLGSVEIVVDVVEALRDGRKSKRKPRWATPPTSTRRGREIGTCRFVWNEARTRCYAIVRGPTRRGPGWIVATVLLPAEETT